MYRPLIRTNPAIGGGERTRDIHPGVHLVHKRSFRALDGDVSGNRSEPEALFAAVSLVGIVLSLALSVGLKLLGW
jgi:hypothetical protein